MEAAPVPASTRRAALQAVTAAHPGFEVRTTPPSQFYRVRACQKGFFPIVSEIGAVPILCKTDLDAAIIAGRMWCLSAAKLLKDHRQLKAELDDSWNWRAALSRDLPNVQPRKLPPSSFKCVYYHPTQQKWFARSYDAGHGRYLYYPIGGYSTDAETASRFAAMMGASICGYYASGTSQPLTLCQRIEQPMKRTADAQTKAGQASPRQPTRKPSHAAPQQQSQKISAAAKNKTGPAFGKQLTQMPSSPAAPRQRSRKLNNKAARKYNSRSKILGNSAASPQQQRQILNKQAADKSKRTNAVPNNVGETPAQKKRCIKFQPATAEDVSRFRAYYMIYKNYKPYDLQAAMQLKKDQQKQY